MGFESVYTSVEPPRTEVDALPGATVVEFGTAWCGYCRAAQPLLAPAFAHHPNVRHLKIEDGSRRRLGRSFGVKLWPTLIFLSDGKEVARLVRPDNAGAVLQAIEQIDGSK